jgi:hypothetical protein
MRKKSDLPGKLCATCGLPFTWRKKWEKNWDEVRFCSQKCRSQKNVTRFHEKTEEVSQ